MQKSAMTAGICILLFLAFGVVSAQVNSQAPPRRVVVNLKGRPPVTGNLIRSDANSIEIEENGVLKTIPLDDVAMMVFDYEPVKDSAQAPTGAANSGAVVPSSPSSSAPATAYEAGTTGATSASAYPAPAGGPEQYPTYVRSRRRHRRTSYRARPTAAPLPSRGFKTRAEAERALSKIQGTTTRGKRREKRSRRRR